PFIDSALYVAEYRNFWWKKIREAKGTIEIHPLPKVSPYPKARDEICDEPTEDKGKNFGRIARIGIMDEYVKQFDQLKLLGIKIEKWRRFFKEKND
ncbi:unnamed protein product, partial [marine sediment metagenome]